MRRQSIPTGVQKRTIVIVGYAVLVKAVQRASRPCAADPRRRIHHASPLKKEGLKASQPHSRVKVFSYSYCTGPVHDQLSGSGRSTHSHALRPTEAGLSRPHSELQATWSRQCRQEKKKLFPYFFLFLVPL